MSLLSSGLQASEKLITHSDSNKPLFNLSQFKESLEQKKDRVLPLEEELALLEQLSQFELGRFLLTNKGLNGYWTAYVIIQGPQKSNLSPLENWILHESPTVKATQERFKIFQKKLQEHLKDGMKIASVPCGLMDDLLTLDYTKIKEISLTGIDLDAQSLVLAKENAQKHNLAQALFLQSDAWNLNITEEFDLMTSNGLNIYEPDDAKVLELYKQFNQALKSGGILITSFLTPPPALSKESSWKNFSAEDALKQRAIFSDIIGVAWQAFRTEAKTRAQLEQAGFQVLELIYDSQGIFPTVVAQKK